MFQLFTNPWMLLGLAGIALPIIAHLLSRRRYDVVEWGAMQFLNPSRKTRRRLKLEEMLLLLLRIGLIALIVFAVTRPVIPSGWFGGYRSAGSRTVVIVIDGSNSMSRSDGVNSLHQNAIRRATEFLQSLDGDDSVALVDARDQPRSVIESPLRDLKIVEEQLQKLPPPGGACATLAAVEKAIGILGRSSAAAREVVIFTDRQSNGWNADKDADWNRIDDLLTFPAVRPRIWTIDVAPQLTSTLKNVAVGQIELSREMTVPDFPLRLRVPIRNDSETQIQVPVRLMLDGQMLAGESQDATIPPNGEVMLEFDHAIRAEGTHVLSVVIEAADDAIAVDNSSHAAVQVATSLPVLLVNGTSAATASDRDTFFAELAFAPPENKPPWVTARVVEASELQPRDFDSVAAAVLCNVDRLSPESSVALAEFVAKGNGLFIACGPNSTPEAFKASFVDSGLLPQVQIGRVREAPPQNDALVTVQSSIQAGWMERFLADPARSFLKASYRSWCSAKIVAAGAAKMASDSKKNGEPQTKVGDANAEVKPATKAGVLPASTPVASQPVVIARLTNADPLLIESQYGDGFVVVMTSTLDRTWSDLPVRSDFVPFLYESVFHIASAQRHRNVAFGEPLIAAAKLPADAMAAAAPSPDDANSKVVAPEFTFTSPSGATKIVKSVTEKSTAAAVFTETFSPGAFRSQAMLGDRELASDAFVVNYDHSEDVMKVVTADDRAKLATNDRVRFSQSLEELRERMFGAESVTELWALLMTVFVVFLILELLLTRRAIRRGYGGDAI